MEGVPPEVDPLTDGEITQRVLTAANRILGKSVSLVTEEEWLASVRGDGAVTKLRHPPTPLRSVSSNVQVEALTASGGVNPSPGVDVVRYDEVDAPNVCNTDHYPAIEDLTSHPEYDRILKAAGVDRTSRVDDLVRGFVFLRGPVKRPGDLHHSEDVPGYIARAKKKDDQ